MNKKYIYMAFKETLVEVPTMQKPVMECSWTDVIGNMAQQEKQQQYDRHIKSLQEIKVVNPKDWEDGKEYTFDQIEFKNVCNSPYCDCKNGVPPYCRYNSQGRQVAILKPPPRAI